MKALRQIDCETVEEFFHQLQLAKKAKHVLFRGVSDARFDLTASAFRDDENARKSNTGRCAIRDILGEPIVSEALTFGNVGAILASLDDHLLSLFVTTANRAGILDLPLSEAEFSALNVRQLEPELQLNPEARHLLQGQLPASYPEPNKLAMLGLMQHEGFPTPLLDWSETPAKAAFFAVDFNSSADRMAVYALNPFALAALHHVMVFDMAGMQKINTPYDTFVRPALYAPRYAGNHNLTAQTGMFSYLKIPLSVPIENLDKSVPSLNMIDSLQAILDECGASELQTVAQHALGASEILLKITLAAEKKTHLASHLIAHGITPATIYPNFGGVRDEIRFRSMAGDFH